MNSLPKTLTAGLLAIAWSATANGADIDGQWKTTVETPRGKIDYTFTFETKDQTLTGKSTSVREDQTRESDLTDVKLADDALTFVELIKFGENEMRIEYAGKVEGDEMALTRKVGDFASTETKAIRVKDEHDITGDWKATFEGPRGPQEVKFHFETDGEKLTGKVTSQMGPQTRESEIVDGKVADDSLSFAQVVSFRDNEFRIEYTGKVADDGIILTRQLGDRGSTEAKAVRIDKEEASFEPTISAAPGQQLDTDDKPAFEPPPSGFKDRREGIAHGKLETIEYDSKTVGTTRKMQVYTPPGYSKDKKFPVLYLMHGIGGDETEWQRFASVDNLLDNLIADGKAEPMIVVLPNGRAQKDDRAEGGMGSAPAFAAFERDLLDDVIPTIESRYSTQEYKEGRALAGLSMGGGQTFNFGFGNMDEFAWMGAFSAAPNTTQPPSQLLPDPDAAKHQMKLIMITCGNQDGLLRISKGVHTYLKENDVPHVWHVDDRGHDPVHWSNALWYFTQQIFK